MSKSERLSQNVVISMTANQHTSQPRRGPVVLRAVRRGARALKHIQDEQTLMSQGFWRASRFPEDHR